MKPRSLLVLVAVLALSFAGSRALAVGADAATSWAGLVLVRPNHVVDESGTGSPPLPAGQDGDGFPDTDETVDLLVLVSNKSGQSLTNVVVRLSSVDLKVDCISNPVAVIGSLLSGATVSPATPFRFRVSPNADRAGAVPPVACSSGICSNGAGKCAVAGDCVRTTADVYAARFVATVTADQIPAGGEDDVFDVELDLNSATQVKATTVFTEGFESGLGNMVLMNLDENLATNTLSDGKRCQYNDPSNPDSLSFGRTTCYLGFAGQGPANDWHLHDTTAIDGGRAAVGVNSLHYGIEGVDSGFPYTTYGLGQMDAIRTKSALTLAARICRDDPASNKRSCNSAADCVVVGGGPCVAAQPELSFQHQISIMDDRSWHQANRTMDRAVVAVRTSSQTWRKIYPYENVYDRKSGDIYYVNCTFDPDDDGNNEDSYFQPADPHRLFGPSSTCSPEFAFAYLGDTGQPFAPGNLGRASDGPGTAGSLGLGTWVTSRFDLSSFRGRAILIRWLLTSVEFAGSSSYESVFRFSQDPLHESLDDGWYVDDVRVSETVAASTPTTSLDSADRSSLPVCAAACTSVNASLAPTPSPSPAPGYPVTLSAAASAADVCAGGQLSYEFWVDGNANGVLGDSSDWAFAGPAFAPAVTQSTRNDTSYGVRVRCSSRPGCIDDATQALDVLCPTPGTYSPYAWSSTLRFTFNEIAQPVLSFNDSGAVGDIARGLLSNLRSSGSFGGETCINNDVLLTPFAYFDTQVGYDPPVGDGYYYLVRGSEPTCAETPSYRTFAPKENPGDPTKRDDEITACAAP